MSVEALIQHVREYCDWAESDTHDMETVYELLLSLRNAAERLQPSSGEEDLRAFLGPTQEVQYEEAKRFADFPFQCYPPSYWPNRPHPITDNIHENFAWIYSELRRGLEAMDHGGIVDPVQYWGCSYLFRWGHHASAAIWAIQWHKEGEPDAAPNSRPPSQLPTSAEAQAPDSQRTSSSGGCG
jgi:hypothetical protein